MTSWTKTTNSFYSLFIGTNTDVTNEALMKVRIENISYLLHFVFKSTPAYNLLNVVIVSKLFLRCTTVVADTQSDSIQCLNLAKK